MFIFFPFKYFFVKNRMARCIHYVLLGKCIHRPYAWRSHNIGCLVSAGLEKYWRALVAADATAVVARPYIYINIDSSFIII